MNQSSPKKLKAPFPWPGGKGKVASLVWERLGSTGNYIEPFFGSGAILLSRPSAPSVETINDLDGFVVNFWRSVKFSPEETARWADWPISELDLHARKNWLSKREKVLKKLATDPEFHDSKIAGWWVWGVCSSIGSFDLRWRNRPTVSNNHGIFQNRPHLGRENGIQNRRESLPEELKGLAQRLKEVRIICGDWKRVLTPAVTLFHHGITGVFLDPPYSKNRKKGLYRVDSMTVAREVFEWALENGNNPRFRICIAGTEGEHEFPASWKKVAWDGGGGFARFGGKTENGKLERLWFSPHCKSGREQQLSFESIKQ